MMGLLVSTEFKDLLVPKDLLVFKDFKEFRDLKDPLELLVKQDQSVLLDLLALKVPKDLPEDLE